MVADIVNLMNALSDNSQTLLTLYINPATPEDQRVIIYSRILKNTLVIRTITEKIVKEPINA